jgi:6-pyruvoyltetrahydropterin/6-carboxytetrahydropterin synthase
MGKFQSTKLFDGYSACFRQWKAEGTHCRFLHSYIIKFKLIFLSDVENIFELHPDLELLLYGWFKNTFEYKTFVAKDDPHLDKFKQMENDGIIQLTILESVGCERFSEYVYNQLQPIIDKFNLNIMIKSVETFEHDKNSALFLK